MLNWKDGYVVLSFRANVDTDSCIVSSGLSDGYADFVTCLLLVQDGRCELLVNYMLLNSVCISI